MNTLYRPRLRTCLSVTLAGLLLAVEPARAATAPIYKCFDKNLGLLYTDLPCKDGEKLDLRPGDADPAAVARLERARDQLDQSAAQRILDERHAAAQRDLAVLMQREAIYDGGVPDSSLAYGYGYPLLAYPPFAHPRPPRLRQPPQPPRFAPNPPYIVPRP